MNKSKVENEDIWRVIMESLPWTLRTWCGYSKISIGTLSGWKQGKHLPNDISLKIFLAALDRYLAQEEKSNIFCAIMKVMGVGEDSAEYPKARDEAEKNFYDFLNHALDNSLLENIFIFDKKLLQELIEYKLRNWFLTEKHIAIDTKEIGERIVFLIHLKEQGRLIPPIIFSYSGVDGNISQEEESIIKFNYEYKSEYLVHIAVALTTVSDEKYLRILQKYGVYLKGVQNEEFRVQEITSGYLHFDNISLSKEHKINLVAEVFFRKFLENSYLIYKEILCYKYDISEINRNFFQSNLGIGNYPYAMRRAISFEKKQIENKLKEVQTSSEDKMDLLIDLNCLGGLYGLRLHEYAKQILCIDASQNTVKAIANTVASYNKVINYNEIANVITELFREDTCEILTNRNLADKADCIIIGLGTMSYVRSPELLLRKIGIWLKKDGFVFLSCYNQDSLSVQLKKYENLNYEYDIYNERFVYRQRKHNIPVPVKMYSFSEFQNIVMKYFDPAEEKMWSYPVISSVFPVNEYGQGIDVIKEVDKASASYNRYRLSNGNYNLLIASHYQSQYKSELYIKTRRMLLDEKIKYKTIQHHIFVSRKALLEELKGKNIFITNNFIKPIMIKDCSNMKNIKYFMILLPMEKRIKGEILREHYKRKRYEYNKRKINFCSERDLRQMGFTVGCICPFTYTVLAKEYWIELLCDDSVSCIPSEVIYTYSGRNDMTYEIQREYFMDYLRKMNAYIYKIE